MTQLPDNWREEMESFTSNKVEIRLLREGPKSLAQSWHLMALRKRYMDIKGIQSPTATDCQSSFKEWNGKTKSL